MGSPVRQDLCGKLTCGNKSKTAGSDAAIEHYSSEKEVEMMRREGGMQI